MVNLLRIRGFINLSVGDSNVFEEIFSAFRKDPLKFFFQVYFVQACGCGKSKGEVIVVR